jgi:hypothetical protein
MRAMIEFYPFLALPLALLVQALLQQKRRIVLGGFALIIALAAYNIFAISQYKKSLLHWDSMTQEAYRAILFKTNWPENYAELIKAPDYEAAKKGER